MTSLGSHSNEVCDPRKLKPEPFQDAASGIKIVEVDRSSSVGAKAARRTIEPPDNFIRIMLSRECDNHSVPSYIMNLFRYGRIFYHRQFLVFMFIIVSLNFTILRVLEDKICQ